MQLHELQDALSNLSFLFDEDIEERRFAGTRKRYLAIQEELNSVIKSLQNSNRRPTDRLNNFDFPPVEKLLLKLLALKPLSENSAGLSQQILRDVRAATTPIIDISSDDEISDTESFMAIKEEKDENSSHDHYAPSHESDSDSNDEYHCESDSGLPSLSSSFSSSSSSATVSSTFIAEEAPGAPFLAEVVNDDMDIDSMPTIPLHTSIKQEESELEKPSLKRAREEEEEEEPEKEPAAKKQKTDLEKPINALITSSFFKQSHHGNTVADRINQCKKVFNDPRFLEAFYFIRKAHERMVNGHELPTRLPELQQLAVTTCGRMQDGMVYPVAMHAYKEHASKEQLTEWLKAMLYVRYEVANGKLSHSEIDLIEKTHIKLSRVRREKVAEPISSFRSIKGNSW